MRKNMLTVIVVLSAATAGLGAVINVDLLVGGSDHVQIAAPSGLNPGELDLQIDVMVSGTEGIDGLAFGYDYSHAPSGMNAGVLAFAGPTPWAPGTLWVYPGDNVGGNGMGSEFIGGDIASPFMGGTYAGTAWFKNFGQALPGAGTVDSTIHITNTMALNAGDVITIMPGGGAVNPPFSGPSCVDETPIGDGCGVIPGALTVDIIIPEPATLSLLAVGSLPLLRRRW